VKKVLKLSSLLAAVLLLAALAGVQLLSAQTTSVAVSNAYVSNDKADGTGTFMVVLTHNPGGDWSEDATTTVTVKNNTTSEKPNEYTLQVNASSTADQSTADAHAADGDGYQWALVVTVMATSTLDADQTGQPDENNEPATGMVHGANGDVLTISFRPEGSLVSRTATVTVDTKGPSITDISPGHNTRTRGGTIRFSATVTDSGSGLGADADAVAEMTTLTVGTEEVPVTATKPADGASTVSVVATLGRGSFVWDITAVDALGNTETSEAVAEDKNTEAIELMQKNIVVVDIDPPSIASATTGVVIDTTGDKAVAKMSGSRTAVAVTFIDGGPAAVEDGGGLRGTTIDDSDFRVDVDGQEQPIANVVWNSDLSKMVFITLENDLAGDEKPTVRLVGPVEDTAGNSEGTGEKIAADGISPKLSVSVDGSSGNATNGTLTVLVSADEKSRNPSRTSGITVTEVVLGAEDEDNAGKQIVGTKTVNAQTFRTVTSGEQWEWTFNFDDENAKYNVCVEVSDIAGETGNEGTGGTCGEGTALDDDDSVTFEVDTGVPAPTVTPEKTDNGGAFIEVDLSGEAGEYTGDSQGKIAALTVTIGGDAVDTATLDDKKFTVAPPADGYSVGKLEIVVVATDAAGNTGTFKDITVEITERAAFTVNLRPGYNLISLPGTPGSTDINDVIGADHAINQVLTYSPFVEGGWLSAERGDDGAFAGTLTTIDGSTAYIVRTSSFEPLEVIIPRMALGNVLPPQTNLGVGWNLVPVIDLSSDLETGETIVDYFQGIGEAILEIDPSGRLAAIDGDDATVGKGYWIYASRPAVLLPTRR
jgi:hypothetical protein